MAKNVDNRISSKVAVHAIAFVFSVVFCDVASSDSMRLATDIVTVMILKMLKMGKMKPTGLSACR
jgi:hypothetical protein